MLDISKNITTTERLLKGVVKTPKNPDTGMVDLGMLDAGDSAWITVTNAASPLHGRAILVTMRPDGLLALTGGGGLDVEARRHMVLGGTPRKTERGKEIDELVENIKRDNEVIEEQTQPLREEIRRVKNDLKDVDEEIRKQMGLYNMDSNALAQSEIAIFESFKKWMVENEFPYDDEKELNKLARDRARSVISGLIQAEKQIKQNNEIKRKKAISDAILEAGWKRRTPGDESPDFVNLLDGEMSDEAIEEELNQMMGTNIEPEIKDLISEKISDLGGNAGLGGLSVNIPEIDDLMSKSQEEQDKYIQDYFNDVVDKIKDGDFDDVDSISNEAEDAVPGESDGTTVDIGMTVQTLDLDTFDLDKFVDGAKKSLGLNRQIQDIRGTLRKIPASKITASTMNNLINDIREADFNTDINVEELSNVADRNYERYLRDNSAQAFYDTLGKFWNENKELTDRLDERSEFTSMKYHVDTGAASALVGLSKQHLGYSIDTLRLIQNGSIELAAAAVALEMRELYNNEQYDQIVTEAKQFQAKNQFAKEKEALDRNKVLEKQYEEISRQEEVGELIDQVNINNLQTNNLIEQIVNLGGAFGSLQASGTFIDYLDRFHAGRRGEGYGIATISVGNDIENAQSIIDSLSLNKGKNKRYEIDQSDPSNIKLVLGLNSANRLVSREANTTRKNEFLESIKTNMEGVREDDVGNMIVDDYNVPFWKDNFQTDDGESLDYKWRVEQRNDIEWLKTLTNQTEENPEGKGGGVITRVVGAGKTNTSLGFFANKIAENPEYKAIIGVPKGRGEQWLNEANKFSDLNIIKIDDGASKKNVEEQLINAGPGSIIVMGHRELSRAHEVLGLIQQDDNIKYGGISIDEPQSLVTTGQKGGIGQQGKKIMKVPFDHRMALTATLARTKPVEAYDIIKWASQAKDMGPRTVFQRMYGGFSGGVNAQDDAISYTLYNKIHPYISGSRISHPTFKTERRQVNFNRTDAQIAKQREIEQNADTYIKEQVEEMIDNVRNNPNHPWRRESGVNWENYARKQAIGAARKKLAQMHLDNMNAGPWQTNARLQALWQNLGTSLTEDGGVDKKHVVFVDSRGGNPAQRQALSQMFKDNGIKQNQIKNIASAATSGVSGTAMAKRVKEFQTDPNVAFIVIDKSSSSGYNLQQGDAIHFIGDPEDAATYLQAQGRIARMPREGDIEIFNYNYNDDINDQANSRSLQEQIKLLAATNPAMIQGG